MRRDAGMAEGGVRGGGAARPGTLLRGCGGKDEDFIFTSIFILRMFKIFIFHESPITYRATARAVAAQKSKPCSEAALYYTTRPKRLSPNFDCHAQPPWA